MGSAQEVREIVKLYRSIDYRKSFLKEASIDYRGIRNNLTEQDSSSPTQYRQRAIAKKLLDKLGEPKSWKFYLKCAYHLSEDKIWTFLELAMRPEIREHNRYFVKLANNEMNK